MDVTINIRSGNKNGIVKVTQYISENEKLVRVYRTSPFFCQMLLDDITNSQSDYVNFDSFFAGSTFNGLMYHYIDGKLVSKSSINLL